MKKTDKNYIVFFSGFGGSCSGAEEHGLDCLLAIDNNDRDDAGNDRIPAIQTRAKNMKTMRGADYEDNGVVMDICDFKPKAKHKPWLVMASPPCKRFSSSAESIDEDDEDQVEWDQNLRNLGYVSIDKVLTMQPEFYVMENVTGMLRGGNMEYLENMERMLQDGGYKVEYGVLEGRYFGICQDRKRVILVASKAGMSGLLPVAPYKTTVPFKSIMDGSMERLKKARWSQSTYLTAMAKQARGAAKMTIIIPSKADALALGWQPMAVEYADEILPTIACNAGGGPTRKKWAILTFNDKDEYGFRNATLLEGLRAQGYPDGWLNNLPDSEAKAWTMIGNAVPKPMMSAVVGHLLAKADGKNPPSATPWKELKEEERQARLPAKVRAIGEEFEETGVAFK